jgi:hypothetical protein
MNDRDSHLRDLTTCPSPLRVMELVTAFCLSPSVDGEEETDPRVRELLRDAEELKEKLAIVFSAEMRREVIAFIKHLNANREVYRKSLLLWLDMIEEICFMVEQDLGDNTGPVKLRRVRGAAFYLVSKFTQGLEVPGVPSYLNRFFLQLVVRGTVEFIITLVNAGEHEPRPPLPGVSYSRGLWDAALKSESEQEASEAQQKSGSLLSRAQDGVERWHQNLIVFLLKWWEPFINRLLNWMLDKLLAPPSVPEEFKHTVDALISDMRRSQPDMPPPMLMADWFVEVFGWIGRHGKELRAAIDALSIAIHWTAQLSDLTREERIQLIEEALIIYFDEELGLRGPFFRVMLRLLIDINLDAIEFLYEKRGVLPPAAPPSEGMAVPGLHKARNPGAQSVAARA